MATPPPCTKLGKHCRDLDVTVRISDIEDDSLTLQDAASTWLTGHTQRVTWAENPFIRDGILMINATIHVPCRFLDKTDTGARCKAHNFSGRMPKTDQTDPVPVQLGGDKFSIIHKRKRKNLTLPLEEEESDGSLPVIQTENPCAKAECRTGDNVKGAACCRDLSLELDLPDTHKKMEALLRSRKSPYLCKVKRDDDETLDCEVISACSYLEEGSVNCTLHGRVRPNDRPAKPSICSEWPDDLDDDETGHPGCVLV